MVIKPSIRRGRDILFWATMSLALCGTAMAQQTTPVPLDKAWSMGDFEKIK